jgi:hypothetical protein
MEGLHKGGQCSISGCCAIEEEEEYRLTEVANKAVRTFRSKVKISEK